MQTESEAPSPLALLAQAAAAAQSWHDVGEPDDFPDGAVWPVVAGGVPVAVFRQGEGLYALHDL